MLEILQEILKMVFAPAVVIAALAWLIREVFKSYLSMDLERYKSELQKDLEGFKAKVKAEYDMKTVEFQTRFSSLHQKKAEMIEGLFSRLARIETDLAILTRWQRARHPGTRMQLYSKFRTDFWDMCDFFDEKAIYFDEEIKSEVLRIISITRLLEEGLDVDESSPLADTLNKQARDLAAQHLRPVMSKLEKKFKALLSVEAPRLLEGENESSVRTNLTRP